MIRSKYFWIGAFLLGCIPLLLIDIANHYLSWQTEVWDQVIYAVQDVYHFSKAQKAAVLDKAFERNQALTLLIVFKSFFCLLFLIAGIYMLRKYAKNSRPGFLNPLLSGIVLVIILLGAKYLWVVALNKPQGAKFISTSTGITSFQKLITGNFKGKVVYVDFWGTTCGPCLAEFENFTYPLKAKYKSNSNIDYLYISRGNRYLWKQQIEKYKIDGGHLFLAEKDYDKLYHNAINNDTSMVFMPRYLIVDKTGKVVVNDAKHPSDEQQLYKQLDVYLNK